MTRNQRQQTHVFGPCSSPWVWSQTSHRVAGLIFLASLHARWGLEAISLLAQLCSSPPCSPLNSVCVSAQVLGILRKHREWTLRSVQGLWGPLPLGKDLVQWPAWYFLGPPLGDLISICGWVSSWLTADSALHRARHPTSSPRSPGPDGHGCSFISPRPWCLPCRPLILCSASVPYGSQAVWEVPVRTFVSAHSIHPLNEILAPPSSVGRFLNSCVLFPLILCKFPSESSNRRWTKRLNYQVFSSLRFLRRVITSNGVDRRETPSLFTGWLLVGISLHSLMLKFNIKENLTAIL